MEVKDNVNHPAHYTEGKIECIDYIQDKLTEEFRGYIKGNVLKYITREKHKNGDEDLRKAKWYLDRLVSRLNKKECLTPTMRQFYTEELLNAVKRIYDEETEE